jgi:transposase
MADLAKTARHKARGNTITSSPLALETVQRVDALFEIARSINGQNR